MKNAPLPIGLIGTADIACKLMAAARECGAVKPIALLSRSRATGEAYAAAHAPDLAVFEDAEAFFASGIRAVYIATPNATHAAYAEAAMEHGLAVLLEKPVTLTAAAWDALVGVADRCGTVLMEAMRPLHDPFYGRVRDLLNEIGKLRRVTLDYCQYSSRYDAFRSGEVKRAFDPAYGNAALMDIGVYPAAVAVSLFGEPRAVDARSVFLSNGFEGCGEAILDYGDFYTAIVYSKITASVTPSIFLGEEGALTLDHVAVPREARLTLRNGGVRVFRKPENPINNMVYELQDFANLVARNEVAHSYRAVTGATMRLLDSIRCAADIRFPCER